VQIKKKTQNKLTPLEDRPAFEASDLRRQERKESDGFLRAARNQVSAMRILPNTQALVADAMSVCQLEIAKLIGQASGSLSTLRPDDSKHFMRMGNLLKTLSTLEGDMEKRTRIDRLSDTELRGEVKKALHLMKAEEVDE
tara:strand:+ start:815 stop:1234 length:420 start_codon:yes stop_codon:yes gene_type:complete